MIKIVFSALLVVLLSKNPLESQTFGGGIQAAGCLAQIDGDKVFGFHKPGYQVAVYGTARISKITDLEIQFSFNQRGSRSTKNDLTDIKFTLNYLDVPVLFVVKDWMNLEADQEYYRMHFFGGFSVGKLVSSSSFSGVDKDFKPFDFSWLAGLKYFYTENWALTARYTRSLLPIYKYPDGNREIKMISYFISLGLNYKFN